MGAIIIVCRVILEIWKNQNGKITTEENCRIIAEHFQWEITLNFSSRTAMGRQQDIIVFQVR